MSSGFWEFRCCFNLVEEENNEKLTCLGVDLGVRIEFYSRIRTEADSEETKDGERRNGGKVNF